VKTHTIHKKMANGTWSFARKEKASLQENLNEKIKSQ